VHLLETILKPIIVCFLWGATIAIVASIILELILGISLAISFDDGNILGLVTAIIIAPFAEELTKLLFPLMMVILLVL